MLAVGEDGSCIATARDGFGGSWVTKTKRQKSVVRAGVRAAAAGKVSQSSVKRAAAATPPTHVTRGDGEDEKGRDVALLLVADDEHCIGVSESGEELFSVHVRGARIASFTRRGLLFVWGIGMTVVQYSSAASRFVACADTRGRGREGEGDGDGERHHHGAELVEPRCVLDTAALSAPLARVLRAETDESYAGFIVGTAEGYVYSVRIDARASASATATADGPSRSGRSVCLLTDVRQPVVFIGAARGGTEVVLVAAQGDIVILSSSTDGVVACRELRLRRCSSIVGACLLRGHTTPLAEDAPSGSESIIMATEGDALVLALDVARRSDEHIVDDAASTLRAHCRDGRRRRPLRLAAVASDGTGSSLWAMSRTGTLLRLPSLIITHDSHTTMSFKAAVSEQELRRNADVVCDGLALADAELQEASLRMAELDDEVTQIAAMLETARDVDATVRCELCSDFSSSSPQSFQVAVRADNCPGRWIYVVESRHLGARPSGRASEVCTFASGHTAALAHRSRAALTIGVPDATPSSLSRSGVTRPRTLRVAALPSDLDGAAVFPLRSQRLYVSPLDFAVPTHVPDWRDASSLALLVGAGRGLHPEEYVRIRGAPDAGASARGTKYGCIFDDDTAFQIGFNISAEKNVMHVNVIARDTFAAAMVRGGILVRILGRPADEAPSAAANREEDLEKTLIGLRDMRAQVLALRGTAREMMGIRGRLAALAADRRDSAFARMRTRCAAWTKAVDETHAQLSRLTAVLVV